MHHGRQRRGPQAFRDAARRVLVVAAMCATIVGLGQVGGTAPVTEVNAAATNSPVSAQDRGADTVPASIEFASGRVGEAPDGEITVLVAPGGDGRLQPGADLIVTIEIVNKTDVDLAAGELIIALDRDTIDTRAAYRSWLDAADPGRLPTGTIEVQRAEVPSVAAGRTSTLETAVPAAALGLVPGDGFGPRGVAVQYTVAGDAAAQGRSTVVLDDAVDAQPTPLAVVVPIVPPTGSPALLDADALGALTGPRGALTRLLDAVEGTSATLAIDPRLLISVRALGNEAPETATAWLERLIELDNDSFELPFADADLTLQQQAGLDAPLELVDEQFAYEGSNAPQPPAEPTSTATPTGTPTSSTDAPDGETGSTSDVDSGGETSSPTQTAGSDPTQSPEPTDTADDDAPRLDLAELMAFPYTLEHVAWPGEGTLSAEGLEAYAEWGYGTVLVDEPSVERLDDYDFTPSAGLALDGRTAVAADAQLNEALRLAAEARSDADRDAAIAQISTVLAIVARELPNEPRAMFGITGRDAASNPDALGALLDALDALPWATGGSIDGIAAATGEHRATLRGGAHGQETIDRFRELLVAETRSREYASMFDDAERYASQQRAQLLAEISSARLIDPAAWIAAVAPYIADVDATAAGVVVTEASDIQLVGRETQLPVFVRNDTDHTVTVQVLLQPTTGRLEAGSPVTLRLPPGAMERAQVPVQAISNGHAVVDVFLLTPDGVLLPSTQELQVNVQTEWETVTIVVAAVGLTTLFVWGLFRTVRRRRSRSADDAGRDDAEPATVAESEA